MGGLVAWGFSGMFIGAASGSVAWTLTRSWVDLELSRRR
jgi:predicted PurR-regulated permease PerM